MNEKMKSEYEAYSDLANAIVMQAFDDYKNGYCALRARCEETGEPFPTKSSKGKLTAKELLYFDALEFFKSGRYGRYTTVKREIVLAEAQRQAEMNYESWKKKHWQYLGSKEYKEACCNEV